MGLLGRASGLSAGGPAGSSGEGKPPGMAEALWEDLCRYYRGSPFWGAVFELSGKKKGPRSFKRLAQICGFLGALFSLPGNRGLLLFPRSLDGELIVHRLSRSLETGPLLFFEAENPGEAAERLSGIL
jgi:hypothetical protein